MIRHAHDEYPHECCGFLAGKYEGDSRLVEIRRSLINIHPNPETRYLVDPREVSRNFRMFRDSGWDLLATYHSHPTSGPFPSRTDMEISMGEGIIHFIISLADDQPEMRGWWVNTERYDPADWELVD